MRVGLCCGCVCVVRVCVCGGVGVHMQWKAFLHVGSCCGCGCLGCACRCARVRALETERGQSARITNKRLLSRFSLHLLNIVSSKLYSLHSELCVTRKPLFCIIKNENSHSLLDYTPTWLKNVAYNFNSTPAAKQLSITWITDALLNWIFL